MTRFNRYTSAVFFSAALLLLAPKAHAVDGTVLINQSTSTAGLPGCSSSGFPIIICQPGSYRLSGNLVVSDPSKTGILVNADSVTLDLNGFTISGPVVCTGSPVTSCTSGDGIGIDIEAVNDSVLNGTVRGFGFGGVFGHSVRVERVQASGNGGDGIFSDFFGVFKDNVAYRNGKTGINAYGVVSGNVVASNGTDGIHTIVGAVIGNTASVNRGNGLVVNSGTVANNFLYNNFLYGIYVGCPSSVVGNTTLAAVVGSGTIHITGASCVQVNNAP
jgi:hypothetical protein